MDPRTTREQVRTLLLEGKTPAQVARVLGISPPTVSYHKRKLGFAMDWRCAQRYDWNEIQRYCDAGHSVHACRARFGFSTWAWHYATKRGDIVPRPIAMPIEQLLGRGKRSRTHIKKRLLKAGHKEDRCEHCGISAWRDDPLPLDLHHINGDGLDNRLENLSLLCPNCHSQTPTWGGENVSRRRAA